MARYVRGPLAGIEYTSERQKRNAREFYLATGQVLRPEETPTRARGLFGAAMRERAATSRFVLQTPEVEANREYFLARWMQQNAGRRVARTEEDFDRIWNRVVRRLGPDGRPRPGPDFDRLLEGAGMRTGLNPSGSQNYSVRLHYQQYIRQQWDSLEEVGSASMLGRLNQLRESA